METRLSRVSGWGLLALLAVSAACRETQTPIEEAASVPSLLDVMQGRAKVLDLGFSLDPSNPHWPGEGYDLFEYSVLATIETDGVFSGAFSTPEHLGTHLDAPNHFEPGQAAVDELELHQLVAPLAVVDVREACERDADYQLQVTDIENWERQNGPLPSGAVVVAFTGWSRYWKDYESYKNQDDAGRLHFPGFSEEAAQLLAEERGVRGIGIDSLSVDPGLSTTFSVHHAMNRQGAYHLENLSDLSLVPAAGAWILSAPIKIGGGSGGPARVWAVWLEEVNQDLSSMISGTFRPES